jgi:ABC-type sugar transport system permease subunit
VTLPLLRPALLVALVFRTLDALRVFDLVYVLTGGGPGTATEPIALHAFSTLLEHLRFGLGSALGVVVFLIAFGFALAYVRLLSTRAERAA